jgi:hypothetical protein
VMQSPNAKSQACNFAKVSSWVAAGGSDKIIRRVAGSMLVNGNCFAGSGYSPRASLFVMAGVLLVGTMAVSLAYC